MSTAPPIKPAATPAAPAMSVAARRNRGSTRSLRRRLQLRDAARLDYQLVLAEDERLQDVETPEYFGASADRLNRGDLIVVVSFIPGSEFRHERMVVSTDPLLQVTRTVEIAHVDLAQRVAAMVAPNLSTIAVEKVADVWRLRQGERFVNAGVIFRRRAGAIFPQS